MKTILVPTDFSEASGNATQYAAALCKVWKSRMILFNAYMLPVPVSETPYTLVGAEDIQEEFERSLAKEARALFEQHDIEIEPLLRVGIPETEILEVAKEKNAALIVMGMKNNTKIDKLLGTTIAGVIRRSETPVMVVPQDHAYTGIQVVAYAADLSCEMNETAFLPVKRIINDWGASLEVVHVHKPNVIIRQSEIAGKIRLANAAGEIPYLFHAIPEENVEKGLGQYLKEHPADMLAMMAHKHSFLERLFGTIHTQSMLYRTKIPLLILHDPVENGENLKHP